MIPFSQLATTAATAGNADFSYTDATVANRYLGLFVYDGSGAFIMSAHAGAPIAASQTGVRVGILQGVPRETAFVDNTLQMSMPPDLIILPNWSVKFRLKNGVAGDSFSAQALLMEVNK